MPVTGIATPANFSFHMISQRSQTRSACKSSRSTRDRVPAPHTPRARSKSARIDLRSGSWRIRSYSCRLLASPCTGCTDPREGELFCSSRAGRDSWNSSGTNAMYLGPEPGRTSAFVTPSLRDYVLDSSSGSTVQIASKRTMPATSTSASVSTMRNARPLTATNTRLPPPTQTSGGGTGSRGKVPRSGASIKQPMA
jgi:hypothetical protein